MATQTVYIPIQIWQNGTSYEMIKQHFYGNTLKAKEEKATLQKEYPLPKFIVKRLQGYLTIYSK